MFIPQDLFPRPGECAVTAVNAARGKTAGRGCNRSPIDTAAPKLDLEGSMGLGLVRSGLSRPSVLPDSGTGTRHNVFRVVGEVGMRVPGLVQGEGDKFRGCRTTPGGTGAQERTVWNPWR